MRYVTQGNISTVTPILNSDKVMIIKTNNQITVNSSDKVIDEVSIYDLQGRLLSYYSKVRTQTFTTQNLNINNQMVVVKVILDGNKEMVKKVIIN